SAFMLVGIIYLSLRHAETTGAPSFDITTLYGTPLTYTEQVWLFAAFTFAFMIKVPMVPFHTWLPDAHTEAPTGGSVDLAGVLLKRAASPSRPSRFPLSPGGPQASSPLVMARAGVGIVCGALAAYPQPDMKRLVASSSATHRGFVMLGLYAFTLTGTP